MVWHVAHCEETSGFSVDSPNRLFHSHRRVSPRVVWGGPEGSRVVESDTCSTPLTTDSDERDIEWSTAVTKIQSLSSRVFLRLPNRGYRFHAFKGGAILGRHSLSRVVFTGLRGRSQRRTGFHDRWTRVREEVYRLSIARG